MKEKISHILICIFAIILASCNTPKPVVDIFYHNPNSVGGRLCIVENPFRECDSILAIVPTTLGSYPCIVRTDCEFLYYPILNGNVISVLDNNGVLKDSIWIDVPGAIIENIQTIVFTTPATEEQDRQRLYHETGKEHWIFVGDEVGVESKCKINEKCITYRNVSDSIKIPVIEINLFCYDIDGLLYH